MYFTTDTISNAITTDGDDTDDTLSLDAVSTTVVENAPFERAFDTNKFYTFDVVVARPIEQQYMHDGEVRTFKKPVSELKKATWSLDNVPYPLTHPKTKIVTDIAQIHGFHRRPRYEEDYDEKGDATVTKLYVPVTDSEATEFLSQNPAVSVGVFNDLDWETDEASVDAYQTNLYYDHVAGVEQGRCSLEDGCGIMTDSSIDVIENVDELPSKESFDVDETVKWIVDGDGDTRHGKITSIDDRQYQIETFDYDTETFTDETVTYDESSLHPWVGPTADSCRGESCSCGCHTTENNPDSTITSDTNMTDSDSDSQDLDLDSMVGGLTVDAIAEENEHVEELVEDAESAKDRIDILEDKVEQLETSLDEAEDKLTEFEEGEREPKSAIVDSITDLTGAWDEEDLMDCDYDELDRRKQLAEDAATSPSTPSDDEEKETTTDSEGSETSTSEVDLDEHRSWR